MKSLFMGIGLLIISFIANSQNTTSPFSTPKVSETEKWGIDKFIWSRFHYKTGRNDKPALDFDAIENWVSLAGDPPLITSNGKYTAYGIQNNQWRRLDSIIVQAIDFPWRRVFTGIQNYFFSADGKLFFFQDKKKLHYLELGKDSVRHLNSISSIIKSNEENPQWIAYKLAENNKAVVLRKLGNGIEKKFENISSYAFDKTKSWFCCKESNQSGKLTIYNLGTKQEKQLIDVSNYLFSSDGKALLIRNKNELKHVDLTNDKINEVWHNQDTAFELGAYAFDHTGKQIVFSIFSKREKSNSIWYWQKDLKKTEMKVNQQTPGIDARFTIQEQVSFTDNGENILFYIQPLKEAFIRNPLAAYLDIWSYKDTIIQSTQPFLEDEKVRFAATINLTHSRVIQLEDQYQELAGLKGNFALASMLGKAVHGDRFWDEGYNSKRTWLINLQNGERKFILKDAALYDQTIWFSPDGDYLVYFDADRSCHYFNYNLNTGQSTDISKGIDSGLLGQKQGLINSQKPLGPPLGIASWLPEKNGLLVYDDYDIWLLDLKGEKLPKCITNFYGRKNKILLGLMNTDRLQTQLGGSNFIKNNVLLLRAFNRETKESGYFSKAINSSGDPEILFMGPHFFETLSLTTGTGDTGMHPIKSSNADIWIVNRQATTESPNYFATSNFKEFKQLSFLEPHKKYNWITSELHAFNQLDGAKTHGILYKPENFDSTKKYPVIVSFYGNLTDRLYNYPNPIYLDMPVLFTNPAWMVSHGYLVFTPDIYFTKNKWGPSTVNAIDGAAKYLQTLPYVDANHLGAAGHSNSGRFGYYLLTHSKLFAAMSIGAGITNIITTAFKLLSPVGKRASLLEFAEEGAFGAALGNLWQNKESWVDHTATIQADHVKSPLLLFHCTPDGAFSPGNAIDIFIALRRLEKKVWWLDYNKGDHQIGGIMAQDFTIRYTQFFDHYLKGAPAPTWMTNGIPYKKKMIESRFELNANGTCGTECPVCTKR